VLPKFSKGNETWPTSRNRKKRRPHALGYTLPDIEEQAVHDGHEILLGPLKIKVVRTVIAYESYPEAGPGRWREVCVDEIIEAALEAAKLNGLTPSMFRALSAANFEAFEPLRKRVGSSASET
jgi:hypothetical protein